MIQAIRMKQIRRVVNIVTLRQRFQHPPVLPQRLMRIDIVQGQVAVHAQDKGIAHDDESQKVEQQSYSVALPALNQQSHNRASFRHLNVYWNHKASRTAAVVKPVSPPQDTQYSRRCILSFRQRGYGQRYLHHQQIHILIRFKFPNINI